MSDKLCPIQCPRYDSTVSCSCGQPGELQRSSLRSKEIRNQPTSLGDCAGIPVDVGPVCESCGVPLVEHLGLYGTCAELQRAKIELSDLRNWKAGAVTASQALRIQEVGAELGVRSGESIEAAVLPGIRDLRDRLGRMTARVVELEAQVADRRVVVPELTEEDLVRAGGPYCINDREPFQRGARWAAAFIRKSARPIPADRVLGEGMLSIHPDALNSISDALREIGDTAHNASTGPEVPDVLWGIREKAYEAYIVATDAEAEIMQTANAHAALSSLRANQGGATHD